MPNLDDLKVLPGDSADVIRAKAEARERLIKAEAKAENGNAVAQVFSAIGEWGFLGWLVLGFVVVTVVVAIVAPDQLLEWLKKA